MRVRKTGVRVRRIGVRVRIEVRVKSGRSTHVHT